MLALAFAATLITVPTPPGDMTRSILTDVCLPYVTGASDDTTALEGLGFLTVPPSGEGRMYATGDEAYLLRLTTSGTVGDGDLNRVCVIQARRGGFDGAKASVQPVMREQGFAPEAGQPVDRPIWTRTGVTVSLRQNPGLAAIIRVVYSSLDAGI